MVKGHYNIIQLWYRITCLLHYIYDTVWLILFTFCCMYTCRFSVYSNRVQLKNSIIQIISSFIHYGYKRWYMWLWCSKMNHWYQKLDFGWSRVLNFSTLAMQLAIRSYQLSHFASLGILQVRKTAIAYSENLLSITFLYDPMLHINAGTALYLAIGQSS